MTDDLGRIPAPRRGLQRPREGRILGGVCAAIAQYFGMDPVVVRLAAAALALVSGGVVLLAYLIAWVVIPSAGAGSSPASTADAGEATPARPAATGAREAWNALGDDVRTLAAGLKPHGNGERGTSTAGTGATANLATGGGRSPVEAADATFTALGERVRDPKVRADARRAAASLSTAVTATVDEIGRRGRGRGGTAG